MAGRRRKNWVEKNPWKAAFAAFAVVFMVVVAYLALTDEGKPGDCYLLSCGPGNRNSTKLP